MRVLRRYWPDSLLDRVRLTTTIFALAGTLTQVGQLDPDHPVLRRALSATAIALLAVVYVEAYRRRRAMPLEPVLSPALAVCAAISLVDPLSVVSFVISLATTAPLYGSARRTAVRAVGLATAIPVTIAIAPLSLGRALHPDSGPVLALVPVALAFSALMGVLKHSLDTQQTGRAREQLLAATSRGLVGCADLQQVRLITGQTFDRLCRLSPGLVVLVVRRTRRAATVLTAHGTERVTPGDDVRLAPLPSVGAARTHRLQPVHRLAALDPSQGRTWTWSACWLTPAADGDQLLLVGSAGPIGSELTEAVASVAAQVAMAELNCLTRAELAHQADHDMLTAMPDRAAGG